MLYYNLMDKSILRELRSVLLERMDLKEIPESIMKRSAALNTWGTNAIEGSTIGWKDAQRILLEKRSVAARPINDVLETLQHEKAFRGLIDRRKYPIDMVTILELHEEVFRGILIDAGKWRRVNVTIEGAKVKPPRMEKVIPFMEEFLKEYDRRDIEGEDVFSLGAWQHFNFEMIHPFSDGNGRIGRLLLNLHFLKHNWPPVHVLPQDRIGYLKALDSASKGDISLLEDFLRKIMGSSIVDLLDKVGTAKDELIDLEGASEVSPYDPKYLGLRCRQGELPGVLTGHRWFTSERALSMYMEQIGRKS